MSEPKSHVDCENYLTIDVFKGFCSQGKTMVMADDDACVKFYPAMKCKQCKKFTPTEETLGLCMNKTVAYPEMYAKTCEWFEQKDP
jgi:hypothetical protein